MIMILSAVSMGIAIPAGSVILGLDFPGFDEFTEDPIANGSIGLLRLVQVSNQLIGFGLASILFMAIFGRRSVLSFLPNGSKLLWLAPLILISGLPLIEFLLRLNEFMIPEGGALYERLKPLEESAERLTNFLLEMNSVGDLFINLFVMAAVPAVCEELAFRGVLQSQLSKAFRNAHVGIWVTAFVFSAIHMQFYGFLPRFILGAVLGYLLIYTRSIWAPIIAHFFNNAFAVLENYVYQTTSITEGALSEFSSQYSVVIVATVVMVGLLVVLARKGEWGKLKVEYLEV